MLIVVYQKDMHLKVLRSYFWSCMRERITTNKNKNNKSNQKYTYILCVYAWSRESIPEKVWYIAGIDGR